MHAQPVMPHKDAACKASCRCARAQQLCFPGWVAVCCAGTCKGLVGCLLQQPAQQAYVKHYYYSALSEDASRLDRIL